MRTNLSFVTNLSSPVIEPCEAGARQLLPTERQNAQKDIRLVFSRWKRKDTTHSTFDKTGKVS